MEMLWRPPNGLNATARVSISWAIRQAIKFSLLVMRRPVPSRFVRQLFRAEKLDEGRDTSRLVVLREYGHNNGWSVALLDVTDFRPLK